MGRYPVVDDDTPIAVASFRNMKLTGCVKILEGNYGGETVCRVHDNFLGEFALIVVIGRICILYGR